ncbi:MAG: protein kinase [Planctomycetia bacterium]|nr:protein kinase [Planctomycetia bacterium]
MSFLREPDSEPIPGYKLVEPLGSGGYGEVWKCIAPGGLAKAIKFVYGNLNSLDAEGVRAEQELKALEHIKMVRHPFVLSTERIEIVDGELVIVMELADKSLHDSYSECQAAGLVGIPRDALLRYIRDASEALDHMLEKHSLLHLDIKPRNLFLISDRVKVADFGLVKTLERTGYSGLLGGVTPLYAPPETINNKISPYSDQYSLGIVYQELLTGQRPFTGKNARQLAIQHLHEEPELRPLPEAERPVVARALAKDPTQRWPNCLAFVRALYNAQNPTRIQLAAADAGTAGAARPKSMADTMEDILLEHPADEAPPPQPSLPPPPEGLDEAAVSQLGLTIAQPATGALRPTLIVGLGGVGRRALLELRCRFLDRFGDLSKIPLIRLLYVDCDADAVRNASRGAPEVALSQGQVYHLPLQPVANYRRRILDHLNEWLPREKLYSIPRNLQPQGCRALGRLAFADNHLRLLSRLRRELQQATHPDTLYQSVSQTGLALRENVPRVYLIAATGGGSSGMLSDLGYAIRTLLKQLHFTEAEILTFLVCGAPSDPATPPAEQANTYACLTELNHFADPSAPFSAQYGPDAPRLREEGKSFNAIYLTQLEHRSPEALRDTVAHLGSYLFHDLTTPLGAKLERSRKSRGTETTPFRSFGTFAVWFPRGLMLRLAARQTCAQLLTDWESPDGNHPDHEAIEAACLEALNDPALEFENVSTHIEDTARLPSEGKPTEALTGFLWQLEEQSQSAVAQEDPGNWSRQALAHLQEWIGSGLVTEHDSSWRQSRLGRAMNTAVGQAAQHWDKQLSKIAFAQMDRKGRRLSAAENAFEILMQFCQESMAEVRNRLGPQTERTQEIWHRLDAALEACLGSGGGFNFFGSRSKRVLRNFMDQLAGYARQHLSELVTSASIRFYSQLYGRFEERIRELGFCRQRLRHLQEILEAPSEDAEALASGRFNTDTTPSTSPTPVSTESYWDDIRESSTVRVVLPDGETDLGRAAEQFVSQLTEEHWQKLDQALQERVLAPLGGLHHLCTSSGDLLRGLATPLTEQAAVTLGDLLPVTDVAEVEFSAAAAAGGDIHARTQAHFTQAVPLVESKGASNQHGFLLLPASEAGKNLGEQAKQAIPSLNLLRVTGQADLMFCREQGNLTTEDIQRLLRPFRAAYQATVGNPPASSHARFDISDWVPLEP